MSRLRAAIVLFAVVGAGLVAPTEARAAGVGVLDRDVLELNSSKTSYSRTSGPEDVVSATVSATNQIVLSTSSPTSPPVTLTLGDGTRPQSGGYYLLGKTTNNRIAGICGGQSDGHLAVDHVAYSGDTVTELYARYGTSCSALGSSSGLIRVGLTTPYAVARTSPVAMGQVPASLQSVAPVRFVNTGTGTTGTLAAATVGTNIVGQTDFSVVTDGCAGRTLAPGEECTVDIGYSRATAGTSYSLVKVGDVTYPGRVLVTGITATAVLPPTAPVRVRGFAVRGGHGLVWSPPFLQGDSYRVMRSSGSGWVDASGSLPATTRTWVDSTLAPGESGTYSVVANNLAGDGPVSEPVTVTRPSADAVVGATDALTVDLRPDDPASWIEPVRKVGRGIVISTGAASPDNFYQTLSTPELSVSVPAFLAGPGHYSLAVGGALDTYFSVSALSCGGAAVTLDVEAVSYTSDGALETLTADYRVDGCASATAVGHINYHSPKDVAALTLTPSRTVLADSRVGTTSATATLDLVNLGGLAVPLGARALSGAAAGDWSVVSDTCGDELAVGARCAILLNAAPTSGGDRDVTLSFTDTTLFGSHAALVKLHAVALPSAPTNVSAIRLPHGGVDLAWDWPTDTGGEGATRWYVRRQAGGAEQTFTVDDAVWVDPNAPAGATYTVSMENTIGEGPQSAPVTPSVTTDALAVKSPIEYGGPTPKLAALAVPDGLEAVPWVVPGLPDEVIDASSSPDGREIATARWGADGGYEIWRHAVAAGATPRKVWSTPLRIAGVEWSPDGARLAVWTTGTTACCMPTTQVVDIATGKLISSSAGVGAASWLPDSRTLVASAEDSNFALVRVDSTTGRRLGPVAGSPRGVSPTVSPDGRWLTWNEPLHLALSVAPLLGGTPHEVTDLYGAGRPVWAPDARSFVVMGPRTLFGSLNVVSVSNTGTPSTPAAVDLNWGANPGPLTWLGRRVAIKALPAVVGRVATVSVDASSLPSGTALTCAVDAGAFVPCAPTWKTPALSSGTHTLRARTVEPDGRTTVTARTVDVDGAAPVAKVTALPVGLLATGTTVRFSGTDTGGSTVASYDVRYRYATPAGSFTALSQPTAWQGLKSTSLAVTLGKGYTYCFSVRARDALGNVGGWTAETCTSTALDDRSLTATGWTRAASASYYLGTYTTAAANGRVMSVRASARQVGLVVTTCSTCGSLDVRLAGAYLGRKSLATSTTRLKQVIWLPLGALRTGTLTLTTVGTKRVHVDGVVLRH